MLESISETRIRSYEAVARPLSFYDIVFSTGSQGTLVISTTHLAPTPVVGETLVTVVCGTGVIYDGEYPVMYQWPRYVDHLRWFEDAFGVKSKR